MCFATVHAPVSIKSSYHNCYAHTLTHKKKLLARESKDISRSVNI